MVLYGGITYTETNERPQNGVYDRTPNQENYSEILIDRVKAEIRVSLPAKVVSFNTATQRATVQPGVREKLLNKSNGQVTFDNLPRLEEVPVCFPRGGDYAITFPVVAGDEVLLVFSDTNIDSWLARGDVQNWIDRRRHDLTDAVALIGLSSAPKAIENFSESDLEIRNLENDIKIKISSGELLLDYKGKTLKLSDSETVLTHGNTKIEMNGTVLNLVGTVKINGFTYLNHTHPTPAGQSSGVTQVP